MLNNNLVRPEDIVPDGVDSTIINGQMIRKGTIAAFLANISLLESQHITEQQKQEVLNIIEELAPAVIAVGLHQHVVFKNPEIEQILINVEK